MIIGIALVAGQLFRTSPTDASANSPTHTCTFNDLEVAAAWGPGGFAGTEATPFLIANVSHRACTLKGFPSVHFYAGLPHPVKMTVLHKWGQIFAEPKPRLVSIAPGGVASFGLSYSDGFLPKSDLAKDCDVNTVYVTLPVAYDSTQSYEDNVDFDICQSNHEVSVTPIEEGPVPRRS